MSITFDVNEKATRSLGRDKLSTISAGTSLSFRLTNKKAPEVKVDAFDATAVSVVDYRCSHPMIEACTLSFDRHYPLVLTPDTVWLCIAQGFANHVNVNSNKLRKQFVAHEGKQILKVEKIFNKNDSDNRGVWQEIFTEFSNQLSEYIGKKRDLIVSNFSTTSPITKAASEVVLMDSMKTYFKYAVMTMCGIPSVTLEGTVDDWKSIRTRVQALSEFDLSWWTDTLLPVTDQLVATAEGNPNVELWNSFYKSQSESGGDRITGWINTLFPYVEDYAGNLVKNNINYGATLNKFPAGLSKVPFKWQYFESLYDMEFIGGFPGVSQDEKTLAVTPTIGWAIREVNNLGIKVLDQSQDW